MKELITRTITAVGLLSLLLLLTLKAPPPVFFGVLQVAIALALWELLRMVKLPLGDKVLIFLFGALISLHFYMPTLSLDILTYLFLMTTGLFLLRTTDKEGLSQFPFRFSMVFFAPFYIVFTLNLLFYVWRAGALHLLFLVALISIGDTAAYFVGSLIGKHKIYPVASPKKSLEGFLAAVAASLVFALIAQKTFYASCPPLFVYLSALLLSLVTQVSDPVESLFKRAKGVKDSSALLPGQGGIFDRLDSYIFGAPLFYLLIRYFLLPV